jgi:TonB family protein
MNASLLRRCLLVLALAVSTLLAQTQEIPASKAQKVTVLKYAIPKYPAIAKTARITGEVTVKFNVEKDGTVSNARVIGGPPMLAQASLDAIKSWKFQCLSCGFGKPFEHQVVFGFRIGDKLVGSDYTVESQFPDRLTLTIAPILVQPQRSDVGLPTTASIAVRENTTRD